METTGNANKWVEFRRETSTAVMRLFCLPFAGGSAAVFRTWQDQLLGAVEVCPVQLPGRWSRLQEPAFTRVEPLMEALLPALEPLMDMPFAIFGHSLGASLAFEMGHWLRLMGEAQPEQLLLSGRRPVHITSGREPVHGLSDEDFVTALVERYDGIPPEILNDREMLEFMLPTLRADLELYETYRPRSQDPLPYPLTIYGGLHDPSTQVAHLDQWRQHSSAGCEVHTFDGGHFFLKEREADFMAQLNSDLEQVVMRLA